MREQRNSIVAVALVLVLTMVLGVGSLASAAAAGTNSSGLTTGPPANSSAGASSSKDEKKDKTTLEKEEKEPKNRLEKGATNRLEKKNKQDRAAKRENAPIVKSITIDKTEIMHSKSFHVDVTIGGQGTSITQGQQEIIDFSSEMVNITLPRKSIPLVSKENLNTVLGEVTFTKNQAIIKFTANADEVEGHFDFNVEGHYSGDLSKDGNGMIHITCGTITKDVKVIHKKGGTTTDETFAKRGVWDTGYR